MRNSFYVTLLTIFCNFKLFSQETKLVHGIIYNNKKEGLSHVLVKNKNEFSFSHTNGIFKIKAKLGDTLLFSLTGFEKQEYILNNFTDLVILLKNEIVQLENIKVVGSRSNTQRINFQSPIPVDKVSSADLKNTGQLEVGEMLQYIVPSFNANRTTVNGIANYAAPATLKGLSPDQTLLLIEGKRQHQFSNINNAITVGKGTVTTDMNVIPAIAIENIEVLKDGAAAQYGSDAIAGIINFSLMKSIQKLKVNYYTSITNQNDGYTNSIGLNYGVKIGSKGFLNISTFYLKQEETNRADNYTGNIYSPNQKIEDSTRLARKVYPVGNNFKANIYGLNRVEAGQFFYNFENTLYKNWHLYSFGGYSNRYITSWGFLRNAQQTEATSNPTIYPDGYLPVLPGQTIDYSTVWGVKKITKDNWNFDISSSIGENYLDFWAYNSSNPSMGILSPKNFYLGRTLFNQITNELNISKHIQQFLFFSNFNFATGIQFRIDNFKMYHGDSASYFAGPLTSINKDIGATGRPGISISNEIDTKRNNTGLYVDLEGEINKKLLLTSAIRYENYSDFGNNISFKFATIYQLNKQIGFRMSINKGFRAPSLQQIYNNQTSSTAQAGLIRLTENIRSNDPRLSQIGIQYPKPEISYSYNLGATFKNIGNPSFKASIDFYQINITDRIVISEILTVKDIPILANLFPTQKTITFFTNAINTQTNGLDFIGNYNIQFDKNNTLNINATYTYNQTLINNIILTPPALLKGVSPSTKVNLFDTISIGLIENAQPINKWILQLSYTYKRISVNLKSSFIGSVKTFEKYGGIYRNQIFSGKNLVDLNISVYLHKKINIQMGINNLFDIYPDKIYTNYAAYTNGQVPFTRNAYQFPLNGRTYFLNINLNL